MVSGFRQCLPTIYTMYSHNGDIVNLDLSDNEVEVVLSGGQLRFLKKQLAGQEK